MKNKTPDETQLISYLNELYAAHRSDLGDFPWEYEADRWHELINCLWIGSLRVDAALARDGLRRLVEAGWTSAANWARATEPEHTFCARVLVAAGFDEKVANHAIAIAVQAAKRLDAVYSNGVHLMLRKAGEQLRQEMTELLAGIGIENPQIAKGATLWLQNVANLPLLVPQDEHVAAFCQRFRMTPTELLTLCDRLGLNVAVLDDLLAADHLTRGYLASVAEKPRAASRSSKNKSSSKQKIR